MRAEWPAVGKMGRTRTLVVTEAVGPDRDRSVAEAVDLGLEVMQGLDHGRKHQTHVALVDLRLLLVCRLDLRLVGRTDAREKAIELLAIEPDTGETLVAVRVDRSPGELIFHRVKLEDGVESL